MVSTVFVVGVKRLELPTFWSQMAGCKLYIIDKQNAPVNLFIWSTKSQSSNCNILYLQNKINIPNAFNKKSRSICGFYGHINIIKKNMLLIKI